jgi:uncharacterized protein YdcH (DUF465 family)
MAKPAAKDVAKKPQAGGNDRSGLIATAAVVGGALASFILILTGYDLGIVDFRYALHGFDVIAVSALVVMVLVAIYFGNASARQNRARLEGLITAIRDEASETLERRGAEAQETVASARSEVAALVKDVERKVDTFLGSEFARLKDENAGLRSALEARQKTDHDSMAAEIETLRRANAELQDKINHWAVDAVDSRIERKSLHAA